MWYRFQIDVEQNGVPSISQISPLLVVGVVSFVRKKVKFTLLSRLIFKNSLSNKRNM